MVVSKDTKRRRKETVTPPPQSAVESSPEMPKRTKVQAQRKFAQGQNAPVSTFNSLTTVSSSSNNGPSTSSESREPPIEILPDKRPKTEDFLTFLCFRGTPALPARLDYLNQGKSKETEPTTKKPKLPNIKTAKPNKKGKKGRPKSIHKNAQPDAVNILTTEIKHTDLSTTPLSIATTSITPTKDVASANSNDESIIPFAVRKRAEVIPEGNKRGKRNATNSNTETDKCNNSPDLKRRSNRTSTKETKPLIDEPTDEEEDDDGEEYLSANDESAQLEETEKAKTKAKKDMKPIDTPLVEERKSETPSKDSETGKSAARRGRPPSSANKKANDLSKVAERQPEDVTIDKTKDKLPMKRPRQKESPIFIPSPEPSGRMTRQRAFFEPVKVPQHNNEAATEFNNENKRTDEEALNNNATAEKIESKTQAEPLQEKIEIKPDKDVTKSNSSIYAKEAKAFLENGENSKNKSNLNVFDFSSDDEQPLAKAIKLKKSKSSPRKPKAGAIRGRKSTPKKPLETILTENIYEPIEEKKQIEEKNTVELDIALVTAEVAPKQVENIEKEDEMKSKPKRGKAAKKKAEDSLVELDHEVTPPSPKKTKSRKSKTKTEEDRIAQSERSPSPALRNQRPSRKTKEAAAIYMGIIRHKLQLDDDDEDDLSLSSFPDVPNVKEMEKMENEMKKNAAHAQQTIKFLEPTTAAVAAVRKPSPKPATPTQTAVVEKTEKPTSGRRGRPPKQPKQPPVLIKREIEGMLVKKGALAKMANSVNAVKEKTEQSKVANFDDEEDFLINEELNETKRNLEKSFSDSDDEPLAIKVPAKSVDKEHAQDSPKPENEQQHYQHQYHQQQQQPQASTTSTHLTLLTIASKSSTAAGVASSAATITSTFPQHSNLLNYSSATSPINLNIANATNQTPPSPLKGIEKKSPVPTSKILNVPATYALPGTNPAVQIGVTFNKTTSYLPQASPHYHTPYVRPTAHQFSPSTSKSPTAPLPPQSPLKYQTPPTTYPPPIEAYQCPKINPNFLTPKFDRTSMPRSNNFPSPSPVKFDMGRTVSLTSANLTLAHAKTTATLFATASTSSAAAAQIASADPMKDEISSILAANLMPSKEESGKIFGIASVSLAQSSGPDNTKCTLGKCGSIHKPVLGPVVPTEGYFGDQLTSKERRKAKVNMTHEQIQKWLIECSSNPDDIQDDLDDEFDDNLRSNHANTPPATRDDKESTSFSSSSKNTRELGKSECAWSAKGPSLKATLVVATSSRKDEDTTVDSLPEMPERTPTIQAVNLTHRKLAADRQQQHVSSHESRKTPVSKEQSSDKKLAADKKAKDVKPSPAKENVGKDNNNKHQQQTEHQQANKHNYNKDAIEKKTTPEQPSKTNHSKQGRKKQMAAPSTPTTTTSSTSKTTAANATSSNSAPKTPKRTPVYNQRNLKQTEHKQTPTTSHKPRAATSNDVAFGAFCVDNEKSIYSFDKDDDTAAAAASAQQQSNKSAYKRQSRRDSQPEQASVEPTTTPSTQHTSPTKKRAAAAAAERANKDLANASQNSSVLLTLSPTENCKLVKVSLDGGEQRTKPPAKTTRATKKCEAKAASAAAAAAAAANAVPAATNANDADSDADGHTFYIPLQGTSVGGDGDGGIQGVTVKLGREGPEGPNQKVVMHATLVTKADSLNTTELVKTLMNAADASAKKSANSAAAALGGGAGASNSASNSLKNVPIGTVQPRFKASDQPSTSNAAAGLVRVNSNSSLFSGSAKSRAAVPATTANANVNPNMKKFKDDTPIKMSNNTAFPRHDDPTQMVEAPIFRPTEKEFADPIEFIERITPIAARFGICKIIPPATFKPECRISDEMRFTAYNQYVHKMLHRWGPSAKEFNAIKKYLATQRIVMTTPPLIGCMEVDLPRLYHTVQELGGLKEVIEKKKWARVAEEMCIPKLAQDRVTKLDDIYCKYLLPYDTLSPAERQKLFDEVEADWAKREARARRNADRFVNTESVSNEDDDVSSDEDEESEEEVDGVSMECIVKGRSMPLSQFYRIARNTMALWFKNTDPTVNDVEAEFWRHVAVRDSHVCVHSGSIDSSGWGYGFPSPGPKGKGSNYARHPWNLKVLTNNAGSVLRSLGPVMGVTVPTLHVGMLFSACCWYRDPHGLSWIEYLHTGASKLWYGIPDDQSANFRSALTSLIPTHCQNKTIWLPCDTVMVPPHMLTDRGVSLCRIEQKPGEFIVVFPRAYTSSVATGYVVSESVYFATMSWLDLAKDDFRDIHDSCEPAMFSLEQLLFALGYDQRVTPDTLRQMLPMLNDVFDKETAAREQLKAAGVTSTEKAQTEKSSNKAKKQQLPFKSIESECDLCRANLYISMVRTEEGSVYCLQHALKNLNNGNIQAKQCKLIYAYNVEDIEQLIKQLTDKIQQKRSNAIGGGKKSK